MAAETAANDVDQSDIRGRSALVRTSAFLQISLYSTRIRNTRGYRSSYHILFHQAREDVSLTVRKRQVALHLCFEKIKKGFPGPKSLPFNLFLDFRSS